MIIAIDGPAASGKGTIGKRIADYFSLPHLDTGSLYRLAAHHIIENNIGDLEPSFPIIDDQTVANGGFGIASFGITSFAKEEDRVA